MEIYQKQLSTRLILKYHIEFGCCIYVNSNYNNWDKKNAFKMQWTNGDHWVTDIQASQIDKHFEYKYFIASFEDPTICIKEEKSSTRNLLLHQNKKIKGIFSLNNNKFRVDYWESKLVTFCLMNPLPQKLQCQFVAYISGNLQNLKFPEIMKEFSLKGKKILKTTIPIHYQELNQDYHYSFLVVEKNEIYELTTNKLTIGRENLQSDLIVDRSISIRSLLVER